MKFLLSLTASQQVGLLFLILFGGLLLVSAGAVFLAMSEKTPLKHWLTREVFRAVYVDRERKEGGPDPLEPLVAALEQGDSLVIFPEGTRSNKGLPQDFKSGLFRLAQQFPQVQLIPCWIDNVQRVMPKGEVVPVPILCTVTFGAPCNLQAEEPKADFLRRARDAVIALKPGGAA